MTIIYGLICLEIHNHGPLNKLNADPAYRSKALTNEQRYKVILFAHQGDKPSDIAVKINVEDPDIELIPCDITNIVHKENIQKRGGKTEIEFRLSF